MVEEKFKKLGLELAKLYDAAYEIYKKDVDNIIDNKIVDVHYIEHTLDNCLGIYTEKGFDLFLKLVFYYSTVNLECSYAYIDILKEQRKEEYDDYVKKLEKKK